MLARGTPTGGTATTIALASELRRPLLAVDFRAPDFAAAADAERVRGWIAEHRIATLNVAGPRESIAPGIYAEARAFLTTLLAGDASPPTPPANLSRRRS